MAAVAPLPNYEPVTLAQEIAQARKQFAISRNYLYKHSRELHPVVIAQQLQCLTSVIRTLERLQELLGPDAVAIKHPLLLKQPAAQT